MLPLIVKMYRHNIYARESHNAKPESSNKSILDRNSKTNTTFGSAPNSNINPYRLLKDCLNNFGSYFWHNYEDKIGKYNTRNRSREPNSSRIYGGHNEDQTISSNKSSQSTILNPSTDLKETCSELANGKYKLLPLDTLLIDASSLI